MTDDFGLSLVDVRARVKLPESAASRITVVLVDVPRDEGPFFTTRPDALEAGQASREETSPTDS
jgi:hypothetical protein